MATCRECLHFETCLNDKQQTRYYGEKDACNNVEDLCRYFLPKSDYVKRERGEWIFSCTYNHTDYYRCSVCGYVCPIFKNTHFCQHCSADMRKEDNNER